MASTLALCLPWRNSTGEKPGHLLHDAKSPADSPDLYYCVSFITAIAFSIPLAWSQSSHRVYRMALWRATYRATHFHTCTRALSIPYCFSASYAAFFPSSLLKSYFSPLWRTAIRICLGNLPLLFASVKLLQGMFCYKRLCSVVLGGNILASWMIIFCLTAWFYTWVCAVGAIRMDRTLLRQIMFRGQIHK